MIKLDKSESGFAFLTSAKERKPPSRVSSVQKIDRPQVISPSKQ